MDLSKEVFQFTKQQECNISNVVHAFRWQQVQVKQVMKPLQYVGY